MHDILPCEVTRALLNMPFFPVCITVSNASILHCTPVEKVEECLSETTQCISPAYSFRHYNSVQAQALDCQATHTCVS